MNVLITGATGFVGQALCRELNDRDCQLTVLSRQPPGHVAELCGGKVHAIQDLDDLRPEQHFDVVINLAGEGIADQRWSAKRKQQLRDSRITLTDKLVGFLGRCQHKPAVLISGSAVGFYGNQGSLTLTENSPPRTDFAHQLCRDWERAAQRAEALGIRVCVLRIGVVLGPEGGIIKKMSLPFRLGLGGPISHGQQWMSWVHRSDLIAMILLLMSRSDLAGVFNATAPGLVTNREFSSMLAAQYRRPAFFSVPGLVLKLALGEMSELLLGGQRVVPKRLLDNGFNFRYPELSKALAASCR